MKHLLNGVAIAAMLAVAGPVWAQTSSSPAPAAPAPSAPAPAPAAPAPSAAAPAPSAPAPSAPAPAAKPAKPTMSSAMPPRHRRVRHYVHHPVAMRHAPMAPVTSGDIANQLNRQELQRLESH